MIFTILYCVLEREVSIVGVENWLEENDCHHGYQVLSTEEIVESILAGDQAGESSSSGSETRWRCYKKCLKYVIVLTLSYNMLMRQMTVTFKVFMNTSAH